MANSLDHLNSTSSTAIGKGKVGEPTHEPGTTGITIKAAIFFDGTKNNRTNSNLRLSGRIKVADGDESSYANSLSNVAIMELLNTRRDRQKHEVSVYVEGIGTNNFVEGATVPDKKNKNKRVPMADKDNGPDDGIGYAIGSGTTGIVSRVTAGIARLRDEGKLAYKLGREYVSKIVVDVVGFSRGAAAARHFVHRRQQLSTGWPKQGPPAIEINFVGIFDTVSSYESWKGAGGEAGLYLGSLGLVPGPAPLLPVVPLNPHMFSTDTMFGDDVLQLGLDMHGVPKKVVHLTAQNEYRENFSLTNINTTIQAHRGLEVSLPGAHSDIGGGYTEGDTKNPRRGINKEVRRIHDQAEKQQLIRDGWYHPNQFEPWKQYNTPAIPSFPVLLPTLPPMVLRTPAIGSYAVKIWENGVRYLTQEYQFVALYLMLGFASRGGPHIAMSFSGLSGQNARYQVPPDLVALRNHFDAGARKLDGAMPPRKQGDTNLVALSCPSIEQAKWLRNKYLHRSARLITELKVGMAGREDAGRNSHRRLIIPDDKLTEKPQDALRREAKQQAQQAKATMQQKLDQLRSQANKALEALQRGAKAGLEELGKNPPMMPPF